MIKKIFVFYVLLFCANIANSGSDVYLQAEKIYQDCLKENEAETCTSGCGMILHSCEELKDDYLEQHGIKKGQETINNSTASNESGASNPAAEEYFEHCQFSLRESLNLKLGTSSEGSRDYSYCSIGLSFPKSLFTDARAVVFVFGRNQLEKDGGEVGFAQDQRGLWSFKGTDFLLSPKILKTSFTKEQRDADTVLVGYQLTRGSIAQGGPITVPGIRILRITPKFVASVELNFQPINYEKQTKGYKQLRESVSKELVELVKSIQITPGLAGPTVRKEASP